MADTIEYNALLRSIDLQSSFPLLNDFITLSIDGMMALITATSLPDLKPITRLI